MVGHAAYAKQVAQKIFSSDEVQHLSRSSASGENPEVEEGVHPPPSSVALDQGYGRGGTPIFTDVFEPLARVALYPTDEDGLGTCFGAA